MDLPTNHFIVGYFSSRLCSSDLYLSTRHVNTVYNRHQRVTVVHRGRFQHKRLQNSRDRVPGNRFVTDKKKTVTVDGFKNTRIEFTEAALRSSNYTTNAPTMRHSLHHSFFDLLCLAHGEYVEHRRPPIMNNSNHTSCMYGVTNHFMIFVRMFMKDEDDYVRSILFPCNNNTNWVDVRHTIFNSMYVNWQRVEPYNLCKLGSELQKLEGYMEYDAYLSRLCTNLFMAKSCFLNTANKIVVLWVHELYHMYLPVMAVAAPEAHRYEWYENFVLLYYEKYANNFPSLCGNQMNQYPFKNMTFNHCVPFVLFRISLAGWSPDLVWPVVQSYFNRIMRAKARYADTSIEFRLLVQACVRMSAEQPQAGGKCAGRKRGGSIQLVQGGDVLLINGKVALRGVGIRQCEVADFAQEDRRLLRANVEDHCSLVYFTVLSSHAKEGAAHVRD